MSAPPIPGDPVYLGSFLTNTHWYGVVGDGETPAMQVATMEAVGQDAVICLDALKGEQGEKGDAADIVDLQYGDMTFINSPSALAAHAETLALGLDDRGKAWWVGALLYIWTGENFISRTMGSPGQPGETPHITTTVELLNPDETSAVVQSGTSLAPHLHFKIAAPRGIPGPSKAIVLSEDYDNTLPPLEGQTITWNGDTQLWEPSDFASKHPRFYSVPEAAFTDYTGMTQRHPILSYVLEAQDYDYVPYVNGHIKAFGIELDADPLMIGAEVRIGDPTAGQIVAKSHGTVASWTTLTPHFSSANDASTAVSPDNGVALIRAGQTATFTLNLRNDGLLGAYIYQKAGSQLTILTMPVGY